MNKTEAIKSALAALTQNATYPADVKLATMILTDALDDPTDAEVDANLDAVLKASGSALRHYSMAKTKDDMRKAMRAAMTGEKA